MSDNQQESLFTELNDRESASVSGGSNTSDFSSGNSNSAKENSTSDRLNLLFFLPQPSQLNLYDPNRDRPYKTLVV
ncbi:secretion protein HlyD [Microcoleus sp. bin38.metabat.b11b12b14.051]|uniref:secretion protein HlyD n=1 Tax=Microcoleus sp. bin38.metabat.b11b12b14.051 TaxID=2742709 RepID=UPI0025F56137|nr:secretion protein HlyD [Microcoleus sp. bin38.metabat.b11b12b14.051]